MRTAKIYDFTLTALGAFQIPAEGSYYRIQTASSTVEVTRDGGAGLQLLPGQGERGVEFKRLTIRDKSGSPQTGTILIADANFVDDRIIGPVDQVEVNRNKSLLGQSFFIYQSIAAVAAQFSAATLTWVTGLKNITLTRVTVNAGGVDLNPNGGCT